MSNKKKKEQGIEISVGVCEKSFKKLKVEQRHIDKGKKGDAESCPIALAIREMLGPDGKDASISVGGSNASFTIDRDISVPLVVCGKEQDRIIKTVHISGELNLDQRASDFVGKFDDEGKAGVKPITFKGEPSIDVSIMD